MVEKLTYSIKEVAEALDVSSSLIYRDIKNGTCELPYRRVGRRILIPIKALEDYFNKSNKEK